MIEIQTCIQLPSEGLVLMMLCLTFGGAHCPSGWGSIAESICDLINANLLKDNWNPLTLHSLAQHLVPNKILLDDAIPFRIRRDLIVGFPVDPRGTFNLYIVDIDDNTVSLKKEPYS